LCGACCHRSPGITFTRANHAGNHVLDGQLSRRAVTLRRAGRIPAASHHATNAATARYRKPVEGTPFGRYRLIELLGRGGMGEVWRAYDSSIDRVVALKMLLPHLSQDPDYDKRFRREARAAARLDNPHVVPIYDVGEIDGRLYVTMRLITGTDLHALLQTGPLDPSPQRRDFEAAITRRQRSRTATSLPERLFQPIRTVFARDRCMSLFRGPDGMVTLMFADDR
jgi:hypothetical protein